MKTPHRKKKLYYLSVRMPEWLEDMLKRAAREDCRSYHEEAIFLLEVMIAVIKRQPRIPVRGGSEYRPEVFKGHIKCDLEEEVYNSVFHLAGEYGLKPSELARLLWTIALKYRAGLSLKRLVIRKEDFIDLIATSFAKVSIH
jgi:hypothetical protein